MRNRRKHTTVADYPRNSLSRIFDKKKPGRNVGSINNVMPNNEKLRNSLTRSDCLEMKSEINKMKLLSKNGNDLFLEGDYNLALKQYAEALRISLPHESQGTAASIKYDESELSMINRCESARILINIGAVKIKQGGKGNIKDAVEAFETSIRLARRVTSDASNKVEEYKDNSERANVIFDCIVIIADALQNIGMIKQHEGDLTTAEEKIRDTIDSRKTLLTIAMQEKHFDEMGYMLLLAHTYEKLGNVTRERGNAKESMGAYSEALKLRKAANQDSSHPAVLDLLMSMAKVHLLADDFVTSLRYLDELLKINVDVVGMNNSNVIDLMLQISRVYLLAENYDDAMKIAKETVSMITQCDEKTSEHILKKACTFEQVADVYEKKIELMHAITWHEKALNLRSSILEKHHDLVVKSQTKIAHIYVLRGEFDQAFSIYKVQRDTLINSLGVHPSVATLLDTIGTEYSEQHKFNAAIKHHMKSIEIQRSYQDVSSSPGIASSMCHIGVALLQKQRRSEAMHHFSLALQMYREAHYSAFHPCVVKAIRNMTSFDHDEDDLESTSVFS